MTVRLVDTGWSRELTHAVAAEAGGLRVIYPLINEGAIERVPAAGNDTAKVITRFKLGGFAEGVSDLAALHSQQLVGLHVPSVAKDLAGIEVEFALAGSAK